jgi:hypothetical protein
MSTISHFHPRRSCVIAFVLFVFMVSGCKNDNPVTDDSSYQQANLFPIAPGRLWVSTAYELDTATTQKILSTVHREVSYAVRAATFSGKSAFLMLDSVYTPTGAVSSVDSSYLAVENGDVFKWDQEHAMWLAMFKKSAGLNTEYTVAQYQEVHDGVTLNVTFKGKVYPPEAVTAPIAVVQAYKAEIKVTVVVGGTSYDAQIIYFYFADGYGPVRNYTPVQLQMGSSTKSRGAESLLVSKNF